LNKSDALGEPSDFAFSVEAKKDDDATPYLNNSQEHSDGKGAGE
jgi:hypothetical protein